MSGSMYHSSLQSPSATGNSMELRGFGRTVSVKYRETQSYVPQTNQILPASDIAHHSLLQKSRNDDDLAWNTLMMLKNLKSKTTLEQSKTTHPTIPKTLGTYVLHRMKHTDPRLYSHFADRLWLSRWGKVQRCNVSVPKVLAFFYPSNISALNNFVAPNSGAVVKFNHKAGHVCLMKPNTSLTSEQLKVYNRGIHTKYAHSIRERHYALIPHGVIIEEFLSVFADKTKPPTDFKTYAFDGKLAMVTMLMNRSCTFKPSYRCSASSMLIDPVKFVRMPYQHFSYPESDGQVSKPCGWDKTMKGVQCLSSGINFARIDMYISNCQPYLSEMTMTPTAGKDSSSAAKFLGGFLKSWDIYPESIELALLGYNLSAHIPKL
eukprot:CAMPEP_0179412288 /NCGR_PEP_ID=MMETSP0799-20121207/4383_1 /TAXON_ID=46947 /ORGANISM="Geminigera cryophila, Strain CCMP2564" /LENGTH=375 /DNA_ID=CAMNT_0021184479 /DNA_START=351 /DNA_END=1478 /DNA_ORIENTATION=+